MKLTACPCGGAAAHDEAQATVACGKCGAMVHQLPPMRVLPQFDKNRNRLAPITVYPVVELWNRQIEYLKTLKPCCKVADNVAVQVNHGTYVAKCTKCRCRYILTGDVLEAVKKAVAEQKKAAGAPA